MADMPGEERSMNFMFSNTFTPHTNAQTVHGRPTLKDVEGFGKGQSVDFTRHHFTSEQF